MAAVAGALLASACTILPVPTSIILPVLGDNFVGVIGTGLLRFGESRRGSSADVSLWSRARPLLTAQQQSEVSCALACFNVDVDGDVVCKTRTCKSAQSQSLFTFIHNFRSKRMLENRRDTQGL